MSLLARLYGGRYCVRLPGIVLPAGLDGAGLPLGLQLIGRPFDEETLFSLGAAVEQAAGTFTPERWW
jgi:aspartyl-tRNA(Asn)/glutamyl-tRNA(Gln) amidotransferase subunit A